MKFYEKVKVLMNTFPNITINEAIEALELRENNLCYAEEYLERKNKTQQIEKYKFPMWYEHLRKQIEREVPF